MECDEYKDLMRRLAVVRTRQLRRGVERDPTLTALKAALAEEQRIHRMSLTELVTYLEDRATRQGGR